MLNFAAGTTLPGDDGSVDNRCVVKQYSTVLNLIWIGRYRNHVRLVCMMQVKRAGEVLRSFEDFEEAMHLAAIRCEPDPDIHGDRRWLEPVPPYHKRSRACLMLGFLACQVDQIFIGIVCVFGVDFHWLDPLTKPAENCRRGGNRTYPFTPTDQRSNRGFRQLPSSCANVPPQRSSGVDAFCARWNMCS